MTWSTYEKGSKKRWSETSEASFVPEVSGESTDLAIRVIRNLEAARDALTRRHGFEETPLSEAAIQGIQRIFGADLPASEVVDRIIGSVRSGGDRELLRLTREIDGAALETLEVPKVRWAAAYEALDSDLQKALQLAAGQIANFHEKQKR